MNPLLCLREQTQYIIKWVVRFIDIPMHKKIIICRSDNDRVVGHEAVLQK
jgi:hypothetical protein